MYQDYHAVSIRHLGRCCPAVRALDDDRFLSTQAPRLPLAECTMRDGCRCKYRHHNDRREDFRRDMDFGLPERGYFGTNRRAMRGRRIGDAA